MEKVGFAPSYWLNIGKTTDLTFSYYYLKTKDITDYGQPTMFNAAPDSWASRRSRRELLRLHEPRLHRHETHIGTFKFEHAFSDTLSAAQHAALRQIPARTRSDDRGVHQPPT